MKVLNPGHDYELANFEDPSVPGQTLKFINKHVSPVDNTVLETVHDGTTNEEVLAMLVDRLKFLQDKFPCRENYIAIEKLDEALLWLNKRTADRKARGVEGKHLA